MLLYRLDTPQTCRPLVGSSIMADHGRATLGYSDAPARAARGGDPKVAVKLEGIVREHNRGILGNTRHLSKRRLLPFYLHVKQEDPERWRAWGIDAALERRLLVSFA